MREKFREGAGFEERMGYARAVRHGSRIAVSGTGDLAGDGTIGHPGDPEAQARAALAPSVVDSLFERLQSINEAGVAILMVEQNARRSLALAGHAYVLEMGENRFEGPGRELLDDPQVAELYLGGARRG